MIAYDFSASTASMDFHTRLLVEIAAHDTREGRKKAWPVRSAAALKEFLGAARGKPSALWSEIKPVYVRLQHGKCAFCERLLGADEVAAYESDVEHFRPKKGVRPWPPPQPIGDAPYPADLPSTPGKGAGYRQLPYHELNYMVACKTCNTRCKANFFPVAKKHQFSATDPLSLHKAEEPYLIYPLGDLDEDPEFIVTFQGLKAIPAPPSSDGYRFNRARIVIAFFLLNDLAREDQLLLERAYRLELLGYKIEEFEKSKGQAKRDALWQDVIAEGAPNQPHANCVRSMIRLYRQDPATARQQIAEARTYRRSKLNLSGWAAGQVAPPP